jgi:uncharacterized membrane protein YtjA (UPF0391 family)
MAPQGREREPFLAGIEGYMGPLRPVLQTYLAASVAIRGVRLVPGESRFSPFQRQEPLLAGSIGPAGHAYANDAAPNETTDGVRVMLGWVVTFLIIALIAGVLGFGGIAGASIEIAKIIFVIALVLFLVSAVFGIVRGRRIS